VALAAFWRWISLRDSLRRLGALVVLVESACIGGELEGERERGRKSNVRFTLGTVQSRV
jgi:hypothetical protein